MLMPEFIAVAEVNQVPLDRGLSVRVGDREFALFNVDGHLYALDGRCPHRGGPLGEGITESGHVFCPLHGWEFDVTTGVCVGNPGKPVACFPTRVADGRVEIRL
jgi:NAD(P)H-dependent nitrite reductase small subunit